MKLIRKDIKQSFNVILLICLVFQMLAVITPIKEIYINGYSTVTVRPGNAGDVQIPVKNGGRTYFITGFTGNDTINETESNLSIDRNYLNFKGTVLRFFKILLSCTFLSVMVLYFGYVINKKNQNKTILTILLGGHAPPQRFQFQRES